MSRSVVWRGRARGVEQSPWLSERSASRHAHWRRVADQLRPKGPKLAELMDHRIGHSGPHGLPAAASRRDPLHQAHRTAQREIKRRTDLVSIFPNEAAITRLVGAILLGQPDKCPQRARYMTLETIGALGDAASVSLPALVS